jgi:hypothetical protein
VACWQSTWTCSGDSPAVDPALSGNPLMNDTRKHFARVDKAAHRPWGAQALEDADPAGFGTWFGAELAKLDAAGVPVVAFEVGNELNSSNT